MLLDVWKWHLLCLHNFFVQFLVLSHLPLFVIDFLDVWHTSFVNEIFFAGMSGSDSVGTFLLDGGNPDL